MAKFVALKLTGETGYWLVDLTNKTVEPMDGIAVDAFNYTQDAEASEATFVSGIDVAVVTQTRDDAYAGKYDT
jgi:hypothetical protein